MLPLVFVITVTAIKDGVEDYRRGSLDEEVNTSAATKLGNWHNVNIPADPRNWFEKLLGLNPPGKVTKGVRKLREKEGAAGNQIMLTRSGEDKTSFSSGQNDSEWSLGARGAGDRRLDDIASVDSHSYPPGDAASKPSAEMGGFDRLGSLSAYQQSIPSRSSLGVVDYQKHTGGSSKWERTLWKKLEVGDVVLLRNNDQVPADLVVLSTSDPEGLCYLETKNLDGETNLKVRKAVHATSSIASEEDVERSSFVLDSEPAHQNLYLYHGVLRYKDAATGDEKQEPVTINEFLLRGCAVRNTSWIIGLVVFTGADTKIMMNGGDAPTKRSKIEVETNFNVIVNFMILLVMCTIAAIFSGLYDNRTNTSAKIFEAGDDPTTSSILNALVTFV
jgi:phospholipid-translocating ATPase